MRKTVVDRAIELCDLTWKTDTPSNRIVEMWKCERSPWVRGFVLIMWEHFGGRGPELAQAVVPTLHLCWHCRHRGICKDMPELRPNGCRRKPDDMRWEMGW